MALALKAFELHLSLVALDDDAAQVTRNKTFEIASVGADDAAKRTGAQAEASAMVSAYGNVSGAGVAGFALREIWEDDAIVIPSDNLYKEAVISLAINATGTKKATIYVPAPNADLLNADGKTVDKAHASTLAFVSRFQSGQLTRVSDGEQVRAVDPIIASRVRSVASGKSY